MAILAELHQEHVNLKRLLEMLERKVARFRAGTHPNFQLISDVISYVGGYADTHHHPREDRIYAHFQGRNAELDAKMAQSEQEHGELKKLSGALFESVEGVLNDAAVVPIEQLIDQLEQFVQLESRHLDLEEGEVFPRIDALASPDDWQQVEAENPSPTDPLFGLKQADEYRDLYRALLEDRPGG